MRRLSAVVLALSLALAACGGTDTAGAELVGPSAAAELIETNDVVVLDVRTPEEFAAGALPGARNIDLSSPSFTDRIGGLDQDATYLVYCRSGNRSRQATAVMEEVGFTNLYELDRGIISWVDAGLAVSS